MGDPSCPKGSYERRTARGGQSRRGRRRWFVHGGVLSTGESGCPVSPNVTLSTELPAPPPASGAVGRRLTLLPQGGKKWESLIPRPGDGLGLGGLALNPCCIDGGHPVPPRP